MSQSNEDKVELVNLVVLNEDLKMIKLALNKAAKLGSFEIDESYVIKLAHDRINSSMVVLEKLQNYALKNEASKKELVNEDL